MCRFWCHAAPRLWRLCGQYRLQPQALGWRALALWRLWAGWRRLRAALQNLGVSTGFVRMIEGSYTAQAMIMTDKDNNQITAFHPGAMMHAHHASWPAPISKLGIISPDGREGMLTHAQQLAQAGIPLCLTLGGACRCLTGQSSTTSSIWPRVTVNDYEGQMLCDRTQMHYSAISRRVQALVVTLGSQGVQRLDRRPKTWVPPVTAGRWWTPPAVAMLGAVLCSTDWSVAGRCNAAPNGQPRQLRSK